MACYLRSVGMDSFEKEKELQEIKNLLISQIQTQNITNQGLVIIKDLLINNNYLMRQYKLKNPLNKFGKKCFSQSDEDGILVEIINRLDLKKGTFAEFGVETGIENNTLILSALDWRGFWVGNQDLSYEITNEKKLKYKKEWITLKNILKITKELSNDLNIKDLDVISLDLDGNDYHLTEELLLNGVNPKLFIVEYNSKFFPPIEFIMEYDSFFNWKGDDYFGASLQSFNNLFYRFNYSLICCNYHTGANAFFIQNKYLNLFKDVPKKIDDIYVGPNYELLTKFGHLRSITLPEKIINR